MLSEKYCKNLEQTVSEKQREIRKLRSDKFLMSLMIVAGWSLFFLSQFRQMV